MTTSTSQESGNATGPPPDRLLSPDDVSELLGIPVKTLANWRCERRGPLPLRIGCHVRYRASDVDSWLEERVQDARLKMGS